MGGVGLRLSAAKMLPHSTPLGLLAGIPSPGFGFWLETESKAENYLTHLPTYLPYLTLY